MDINNILEKIKGLLLLYWKTRPFRAFISLNTLALVGFSAFKISYDFSKEKHALGFEVSQGEYNWTFVAVLAVINIPFVIWLISSHIKEKRQSTQKSPYEVEVGYFFENDEVALSPIFEEKSITYKHKPLPEVAKQEKSPLTMTLVEAMISKYTNTVKPTEIKVIKGEINKSFYPVQFYLKNTGKPSLRYINIQFFFGEDVVEIRKTNKKENFSLNILSPSSSYIDETNKKVIWRNQNKVLVGGDNVATIPVFIKPIYPCNKIIIQWQLLIDEHQENGSIEIPVDSNIQPNHINIFQDRNEVLKENKTTICDYIEHIT